MAARKDGESRRPRRDDVKTSEMKRRAARLRATKSSRPSGARVEGEAVLTAGSTISVRRRQVSVVLGASVRGRSRKPAASRARRFQSNTTARALPTGNLPIPQKRHTLYIDQALLDAARIALGGTSEADTVRRALVAVLRNRHCEHDLLHGDDAWALSTSFVDCDGGIT